jgi:hypothetical protein
MKCIFISSDESCGVACGTGVSAIAGAGAVADGDGDGPGAWVIPGAGNRVADMSAPGAELPVRIQTTPTAIIKIPESKNTQPVFIVLSSPIRILSLFIIPGDPSPHQTGIAV